MIESRGSTDKKLKESYQRLSRKGTDFISVERWQARLTSGELKIKPKQANIAVKVINHLGDEVMKVFRVK